MGRSNRKGPPPKDAMLLVVDAQNLYYSARELFGRGARVDFLRLRERVVGERNFGAVYSLAYIPEVKDDAHTLARALKRFGYVTFERAERFDIQVQELIRLAGQYQCVAIASGDGAFVPLCQQLKEQGKTVEVFSFVDAVNAGLPKVTDRLEHLSVEVLMGNYATVDVLQQERS